MIRVSTEISKNIFAFIRGCNYILKLVTLSFVKCSFFFLSIVLTCDRCLEDTSGVKIILSYQFDRIFDKKLFLIHWQATLQFLKLMYPDIFLFHEQ